ncbi:MAG: 4Fe-4S binding protein [Proteobacteria bacterium]|nr:4Fe-4S binding protein [Pseudomonadota bacterium]MBU4275641.1 4Fe-4S binding protein [Pseudomonadota bacterium]MBU4382918.1 4Fe-4S binding protein [Pseudomonadota bacterium]MBU4605082.1 4Fe-4S binding protein [Pseudomonadota bacterium]MCG2765435.1 4Fe-4S binding protein [Desulfarculaceae bacterium]
MSLRPPCPLPENQPAAGHGEMTLAEAQAEAGRCLSGHSCQGCELCVLICPDLAVTKDPDTGRAVIDLAYCKGCGLCAEVCPKGAISMQLDQD